MADTRDEQISPLEELCDFCHGEGGDDQDGEGWRQCGICNGAGYVPTEFGAMVLSLVRHNFKPMLEEITNN